jgi:hypothetical protein
MTERTERLAGVQTDERRERLGGWRVRWCHHGIPHRRVCSPLGGRAAAERSLSGTLPSWPTDMHTMGSMAVASPRPCARARLGERGRWPPQRPTERVR